MIPAGAAHRLSSSHTGRRNALWFLLEVTVGWLRNRACCPLSVLSILGTILIIFVDCPSLLLLST